MTTHRYATSVAWEGATGVGYDHYERGHIARVAPVATTLDLSGDPAFRGDGTRLNPEQLLLLAVSSCQLLSFLAAAARARIDVVAYHDDAIGEMPGDDHPMRITQITLRPRITVRGDVTDARVLHLVEVGHRECFIANSLTTEIAIEAEILRVGHEQGDG
jgi:organic hydroperoxide reductase OsmC/OhrA